MFHEKEKKEATINRFKLKVLKIFHGDQSSGEDRESSETEDLSFSVSIPKEPNSDNATRITSFKAAGQSDSCTDKNVKCLQMQNSSQKGNETPCDHTLIADDDSERPHLSSSDSTETDSGSVYHRRKRKHRRFRSAQCAEQHLETTSTMKPHGQQSDLTKNQKRKLKKKRREKEKSLTRQADQSEFTFDELAEGLISNKRLLEAEDLAGKKASVCEFLQAVWEVYSTDANSINSTSDGKVDIKTVEEFLDQDCADSRAEVLLLHTLMSSLLLPGLSQALEKIDEFENKTILDKELCGFIKRLLLYWSTQVMNR